MSIDHPQSNPSAPRHPRRFLRRALPWALALGLLAPLLTFVSAQPAEPATSLLRTTEDIRRLGGIPPTAPQMVHLRGVLTFVHPTDSLAFLHDATGQTAVDLSALEQPRPAAGDVVALEGAIEPIPRTLRVRATAIVVEGRAPLPPAPEITFQQALAGSPEHQWVRLRGTLVRNESLGDWQRLTLAAGADLFSVSIPSATRLEAPDGAALEVRGVCQLWISAGAPSVDGCFLFSPSLAEVQVLTAADPAGPALTRISEVRRSSPTSSVTAVPVHLNGVVTFVHPDQRYFYLDDGSGGVLVWPAVSALPLPPVGSAIVVRGETQPGPAAGVRATKLEILGPRPLPPARPIRMADAVTGTEDAQWVEMRGRLRQIDSMGGWLRLFLTTTAGEITVSIPEASARDGLKVGSLLVVRGVCQSWLNEYGRIGGFFLYTPSTSGITVAEPPPVDPFAVPEESIANLALYRPETLEMQQVRLRGAVLAQRPGHSVVLANPAGAVRVFTHDSLALQPGDQVEASGVPGRLGKRSVLRGAVLRRLAPGPAPHPEMLPAAGRIDPALDERLVSLTGRLASVTAHRGETRLVLEAAGRTIDVTFPGPLTASDGGALRPGSLLAVTGLYHLEYDQDEEPAAFSVQLRAPGDLVIASQPPWWTMRRALIALGAIALCLLVGLAWVTLLRRQIRRQTEIIRRQMGEQTALAALHGAIVEHASDCVFTTDLSGRLTSWNPAGERMTGRTAAEVLSLGDLITSHEIVASILALTQPRPDGGATPAALFEARLRGRPGRSPAVEIGVCPLRVGDRVVGLLGIARDITERKRAEELNRRLQTAESLGRMAAAIAHHFNNRIQTVLMGLEMMQAELPREAPARALIATCEGSARQVAEIGSLMLTYLGQSVRERTTFDLAECCRPVAQRCRERMRDRAQVDVALPEPGPRVRADSAQIQRALQCLLANAEEALPATGGAIRVAVATTLATEIPAAGRVPLDFTPEASRYACMVVSDTGHGIAEQDLGNLFDPFFTTKFHGRGTGLAIVLGVARAFDGAVLVESRPGVGSCFRLFLPLQPSADG